LTVGCVMLSQTSASVLLPFLSHTTAKFSGCRLKSKVSAFAEATAGHWFGQKFLSKRHDGLSAYRTDNKGRIKFFARNLAFAPDSLEERWLRRERTRLWAEFLYDNIPSRKAMYMQQSNLCSLMRLSWLLQHRHRYDRSRALKAAWTMISSQDLLLWLLQQHRYVRKRSRARNGNVKQLSLFTAG
jgi:hypothetical protein